MIREDRQPERRIATDLTHLAEAIRAIECGVSACQKRGCDRQDGAVPTGWDDGRGGMIGSLARGCVHEWCGGAGWEGREGEPRRTSSERGGRSSWLPPLTLLVHLAWQAAEANAVAGARSVLWVGRLCWPYVHALVRGASTARGRGPPAARDRRLLQASIFVDPPDDASRVWAIDLALRAGAVVIADGTRLDMTSSRRLQLAAEAGGCGVALLTRPPWERKLLSAAATRWLVRPASGMDGVNRTTAGGGVTPRWTVELIRCKGAQPRPESRREWMLELERAGRVVCVLPAMVDRSAAPAREAV